MGGESKAVQDESKAYLCFRLLPQLVLQLNDDHLQRVDLTQVVVELCLHRLPECKLQWSLCRQAFSTGSLYEKENRVDGCIANNL